MSDLLAFVLNLSKSGNFLFRNMSNGEIVSSASFSLVGEITHWCMNFDCLNDGRCWATCKCNIGPTFCIEISSWKNQSAIAGKLFSSYRTVLSTGKVFWRLQNNWIACISLWSTCPERSIDCMLRYGICIIFYVFCHYYQFYF